MTNQDLGSHPTVAQLCRIAPGALVPRSPSTAPEAPISAVHISDLVDPTSYLGGGELLLTTGLTLPRSRAGCTSYVARLREASVAGLALGLGPVHRSVPAALLQACEQQQVPLLVVPDLVPFQRVTRAFWESVGEQHERPLFAALDSHRRLVTAVSSSDPVSGVLRTLAETVDGWVVLTDLRGQPRATWPPDRIKDIGILTAEVLRLRPSGAGSSATFPFDAHVAVLHPVLAGEEVVGYLGAVSPRALLPHQRNLLLSSLALLGLDAAHRHSARTSERAERAAVAHLIDRQHLRAAQDLAGVFAVEHPPPRVRVVAAADSSGAAALDALLDALPEHEGRWVGAASCSSAWMLLHPGLPRPTESGVTERLAGRGSTASVVLGPVVAIDAVHAMRCRLQAFARAGPATAARDWRAGEDMPLVSADWADGVLAPLRAYRRGDLVAAVAAYLRHQGHWEAAASALGVHRNSLRHRISRAERLLGQDLRDPTTSARLWLAIRRLAVDTTVGLDRPEQETLRPPLADPEPGSQG